jgi:hypothetical protein
MDPYNRLVTGLEPEHFNLFEDKVRQRIEYFSDEDQPVSIGVVFDLSGSLKDEDPQQDDVLPRARGAQSLRRNQPFR